MQAERFPDHGVQVLVSPLELAAEPLEDARILLQLDHRPGERGRRRLAAGDEGRLHLVEQRLVGAGAFRPRRARRAGARARPRAARRFPERRRPISARISTSTSTMLTLPRIFTRTLLATIRQTVDDGILRAYGCELS